MPHQEMFTPGRSAPDLDRAAPSALHSQVSDAIRTMISSEQWPSHHKLPSEPELATQLGVSRGTLRRALTTLIDEGLLKQVQGKGTFVTQALLEPVGAQKLSTLSEDFASQGILLHTTVIAAELVEPPGFVSSLLRVPTAVKVFRLVRVRSTQEQPIALLHNYVRADLAPGIERCDFGAQRLFHTLESEYGLNISTARRTFSARAATQEVASAIHLAEGAPVQYLEQLTFLADGRPIEYSDVWINSDQLRVVTHLARR